MSDPATARIQNDISANKVMLFMKGNAMFPQCGFSARVVQILTHMGVPFQTANVLEDAGLREGIKAFSNWPTIPQLYGRRRVRRRLRHHHRDVSVRRAGEPDEGKGRPPPSRSLSLIPAAAFEFLRGLAANNERPWFEANRETYESAIKQPVAALVAAVTTELTRRNLPLEGDPKRSAFRINRDVRFSHNKSPYKTNIGVVWYRQGSSKSGPGVLYFHLGPAGCFVGAAFWHPEPDILDSIRERIRVHPDRFATMEGELATAKLRLEDTGRLTRMPKGFEDLKGTPIDPGPPPQGLRRPPPAHRQDRAGQGAPHQDRRSRRTGHTAAPLRLGRRRRGCPDLTLPHPSLREAQRRGNPERHRTMIPLQQIPGFIHRRVGEIVVTRDQRRLPRRLPRRPAQHRPGRGRRPRPRRLPPGPPAAPRSTASWSAARTARS